MTLSDTKKYAQDRFNRLRLLNEEVIDNLYQYAGAGDRWKSSFGTSTFRALADELEVIKTKILTAANYKLISEACSLPALTELVTELDKEIAHHHEILHKLDEIKAQDDRP